MHLIIRNTGVSEDGVSILRSYDYPPFCYTMNSCMHVCAYTRARIRVLYIVNKIQKVFLYYIEILDKNRIYFLHGRTLL